MMYGTGGLARRLHRRTRPVVAVAMLASLAACDDAPQSAEAPPPAPAVTVTKAVRKDVTIPLEFVGRVVAIDKVEVRARVEGFLEDVLFEEGREVKAGDLLFTIEPDLYEADVQQREAELASAKAKALNADLQLRRARQLRESSNISEATVDEREAEAASAKAAVQQAEATLRQAKINLGYTKIQAPISGRIGLSMFSTGALVGPNSGSLATIVSQDPIYVLFPVSQREILRVRREAEARGEDLSKIVVRIKLPDDSLYSHPGRLDFLGVQVDRSTDTRDVRAVFPNPERLLVDGQFVNVLVERERSEPSLVVPQTALQVDQAGTFVLVVNDKHEVEVRRVTVSATADREAIIAAGLQGGEEVIVQGIQKIRPGQEVKPVPAAAAAAGG